MDIFTSYITALPSPYNHVINVVAVIGFITIVILLIVAAYKFTLAVNRESRVFDLAKENGKLISQVERFNKDFDSINNTLESLNTYTFKVNENLTYIDDQLFISSREESTSRENMVMDNTTEHIYGIINLLAGEIGNNNRKRVSLWSISDENEVILSSIYRSSNFPYSIDTSLELNINNSIAGRAFRTKQRQIVLDLHNDPDWQKFSTSQKYNSILAFPIGELRVLTVDYKSPPDETEIEFMQMAVNYLTVFYLLRVNFLRLSDVLDRIESGN